MQVKSVSVTYGRTINLGNFNSLKLDVTLQADLLDGETSGDVVKALQEQAWQHVKTETARLTPAML